MSVPSCLFSGQTLGFGSLEPEHGSSGYTARIRQPAAVEPFAPRFLFGSLLGRQENLKYDPELLYISALFHDLGLTKHYGSADKRFEVDGANAARSLLEQHGLSKESTQLVWDAIALHQTIGVAQYKEPVVALLYHGVGFDVMSDRF